MPDRIRWGILGTGWIARRFAMGLASLSEAELIAVGSRTAASADQFADTFGVPHRHASYTALVNDPDVDVVYVATVHPLHKENCLLGLRAGKAVLCEKPFTINAAQAEAVIELAREKKLFLMEAMWIRFIPAFDRLRQLLADGVIGEVRMVLADHCYRPGVELAPRVLAPELGGGALLDLGIYPVALASMILGQPLRVTSTGHLGATGVDEQGAIVLAYDQGRLAVLFTALRTNTPREIVVMGTQGRIRTTFDWPTSLTLTLTGHEDQVIEAPMDGNGYNYEAAEVMRCLRAGKLESEIMPLDETLGIMRTLDQIRAQWGLRYPME